MGRGQTVPDEVSAQWLELAGAGVRIVDIARVTGCPKSTIQQYLARHGMRRKRHTTPRMRHEARQLLHQGLTRREIAHRLGANEKTVTGWLTGHGHTLRRPWTDRDTQTVLTMRREGCAWKDICTVLARNYETIRTALKNRGIAVQEKGRRLKWDREVMRPRQHDPLSVRVSTRLVIPT